MRFHEALLCAFAVVLPVVVFAASAVAFGGVWWLWLPPLATLPVSLGIVWLVGWMVDHTYG